MRTHTIELTATELQTVCNALEYAYQGLDSDMSIMDDESQSDIRKLEELKIKLETALGGR